MDRKLWTEARAIAARHTHGDRAAREDLAQDLAVAALEDAGAARQPGCLAGAGRAQRGDRSLARRGAAGGAGAGSSSRRPRRPIRRRRCWGANGAAWSGGRWPRCRGRSGGRRWPGSTPSCPTTEVAARVGTPAITARTRVHRALASLRARLGALRAMFVLARRADERAGRGVRGGRVAAPARRRGRSPIDEMALAAPRARAPLRPHAGDRRGRAPGSPRRSGRRPKGRRLTGDPAPTRRRRRSGWCSATIWSTGASRAGRRDHPHDAAGSAAVADRDPPALRARDGEESGRFLAPGVS